MNIYIVSLVFTKVTMVPLTNHKLLNGSQLHSDKEIDIQNSVGVTKAESAEEAYQKVSTRERLKFPGYNISVRVIIETNEIDLSIHE